LAHRPFALLGVVTIDTLKTALMLSKAALDKKAVNPVLLEVSELVSYADYLLIVTATSAPHVQAIADDARRLAKEQGVDLLANEGLDSCRWVLLDFGDVVLHVFQPVERNYYDLETLWLEAPRIEIPGAEDAVDSESMYFAP
jgi:ribosome-associated protein